MPSDGGPLPGVEIGLPLCAESSSGQGVSGPSCHPCPQCVGREPAAPDPPAAAFLGTLGCWRTGSRVGAVYRAEDGPVVSPSSFSNPVSPTRPVGDAWSQPLCLWTAAPTWNGGGSPQVIFSTKALCKTPAALPPPAHSRALCPAAWHRVAGQASWQRLLGAAEEQRGTSWASGKGWAGTRALSSVGAAEGAHFCREGRGGHLSPGGEGGWASGGGR